MPYSGVRLDYSGVRGGLKRPLSKRDGVYPYDKEVSYGAAKNYSVAAGRDAGDHPLVPKDIEHSHWADAADEIEGQDEAIGTPMNFKQSGTGPGSSTVPGSARGWSSWSEDDEMSDEELSDAAGSYQNMMPVGPQRHNVSRRESMARNAWKTLAEAYVSLKDTPEGQMALSQGVEEAEFESTMNEFEEQSKKAEDYLDSVDEGEGLKFLFQLDPDHAADQLKDVGKDKVKDVYKLWADRNAEQQPTDAEIE